MINFNEWLQRKEDKANLAIFDFDQTLADTAGKPTDWDGDRHDWFAHPHSLDGDNFRGFNQQILKAFIEAKKDPNTHAVILTGRKGIISPNIRQILQSNNLYGTRMFPNKHPGNAFFEKHPGENSHDAHSEFYKGDHEKESDYPKYKNGNPIQEVEKFKRYIIEKLVTPNIKNIMVYEDKLKNIEEFKSLFAELRQRMPNLKNIVIYHVQPDKIDSIVV